MGELGFRITRSLSLLLALLLPLLLLKLLLFIDSTTLFPELLAVLDPLEKGLVKLRTTLLAEVIVVFWNIFRVWTDADANVMLPHATAIAGNPWFALVVALFNSTADASNNFFLLLLLCCLLGLFGGFLLGLDRLIKDI
jgi:hypothetical protein